RRKRRHLPVPAPRPSRASGRSVRVRGGRGGAPATLAPLAARRGKTTRRRRAAAACVRSVAIAPARAEVLVMRPSQILLGTIPSVEKGDSPHARVCETEDSETLQEQSPFFKRLRPLMGCGQGRDLRLSSAPLLCP